VLLAGLAVAWFLQRHPAKNPAASRIGVRMSCPGPQVHVVELSASRFNYGEEESPALLVLCTQENDRWKVIAWAVEVP
jgi:hypothetical protein